LLQVEEKSEDSTPSDSSEEDTDLKWHKMTKWPEFCGIKGLSDKWKLGKRLLLLSRHADSKITTSPDAKRMLYEIHEVLKCESIFCRLLVSSISCAFCHCRVRGGRT
jgi:hypothetical protein